MTKKKPVTEKTIKISSSTYAILRKIKKEHGTPMRFFVDVAVREKLARTRARA